MGKDGDIVKECGVPSRCCVQPWLTFLYVQDLCAADAPLTWCHGTVCLPNVHFATLTGESVYAR
jgi:hypothetical protein